MAFGPIMQFKVEKGLMIELAPFERDDVRQLALGFQHFSLLRYMGMANMAQTEGLELEWYDRAMKRDKDVVWGIWVIEGKKRKLIGSTAINDIGPHVASQPNITQGTTGVVITDQSYWGMGIASAAHKARTFYAFRQLGIVRLKSAVAQENGASRRALERCGYFFVYTERNFQFVDGRYVHEDNLECLNPDDWSWRLWWGDDRPTRRAIDAREVTRQALEWAQENVTLP